ncbi:restriction endonuclease subunit S [Vibrio fluvialis]
MGKYQAFSEYKYSNNEFLGKVPSHWVMGRFKFCTTRVVVGIAEAATHAYSDFGVPIIRSTNIKEKCLDTTRLLYIKDSFAEQNSSKYLYENDIVTIRTGFPGISAVVPSSLDKSQCFTNLISTPKKSFNPKFLTYFLNSSSGKAYFELLGWGSAQKNISVPILQDFPLAHPLIDEQTQIANFLDHETAKIDTLIEKQQQLIKLLKEKRQAVISHAVTKGLNPQAPMKNSGVEWLGEVPEHWDVSRIKYLSSIISKGTTPSTIGGDFVTEGVRFLKAENIGKSTSVKPFPEFFISEKVDTQLSRSRLKENDVLVIIAGATTGLASIVQKDVLPANTNQAVSFIRPANPKLSYWIVNWLTTEFVQSTIWMGAVQAAQPNLSMEDLGNIPIVVPPESELVLIQESLKGKLATLDNLMIKAESAISIMQERRTVLISAAVTGKIDVRNWQAPTSQNQALEQTA